jgi:hypothetical protein
LEHYRLYLLSLQNKIGSASYLDTHNDADALARAPAAFVVSDKYPAIEIRHAKRKLAGSTQSVLGAMDRHSLRFESTWLSATSNNCRLPLMY